MKRKLRNLTMLTLAIATLGFSSVAYANEDQILIGDGGGGGAVAISAPLKNNNFTNPVDRMYYHQFGEGFQLMQEKSREINRSVYEDGIRMEVLSTVTVRTNLRSNEHFTEDGYWVELDNSYTFFTLQDTTGDRISQDMELNLTSNNDMWPYAGLVDFNEDTKTATFVAYHNAGDSQENDNVDKQLSLILEGIIKDRVEVEEVLEDISISDLLNSHNPTFIDQEGTEILAKDELNIPIQGWDSAYISNIALKGNMLHIQTNAHRDYSTTNWDWYYIHHLVNTNTGDEIWFADNYWIDNYDEDWNLIDNREYQEMIFYIDDINDLSSYYLKLSGGYYDTFIDTNIEIDFDSPIIKENIVVEKEAKILVDNKEVSISNIMISPLEISFSIDEEMYGDDLVSFMNDNLSMTLIFEDGTRQENVQKSRYGSHNVWGMSWFTDENEDGSDTIHSNIEMILSNFVINTEDLAAISINGVVIEVK